MKNYLYISLFILILILLNSIFISTYSQTIINGGVVNGVWNQSGSPYLINGAILVPDGSNLTIDPGVLVEFQGSYKLLVLGQLIAIGTASDSITFTAADAATGWLGIRFDSTSTSNDSSKFAFCNFMYGYANGNASIVEGGALYFNYFSKAIITNSYFANNKAENVGGAVMCTNSSPILRNNHFKNNMAITFSGGAIFTNNSSPLIESNVFELNSVVQSVGRGGGICMYGGSSSLITNNTFLSNQAFRGAAIFTSGGTTAPNIIGNTFTSNSGTVCSGVCGEFSNPVIIDNTFTSNSGTVIYCEGQQPYISGNTITNTTIGAGVVCSSNCTSTVTGNTFLNGSNTAISVSNSTVTISNNFISNHSVLIPFTYGNAAGMSFRNGGSSSVINNIIVNNSADSCGGGIFLDNNSSIFTNNTVANNTALYGGSFYCRNNSNPIINNVISWNNMAIYGNEFYLLDEDSDPDIYFSNIKGGSNLFGIGSNAFYLGSYMNNINFDPGFISPTPGNGSGFPSLMADWAPTQNSICIDAGNPSGTYPSTDILGNPRIYNGIIDMGAIELFILGNPDLYDSIVSIFPNPSSGIYYLQCKQCSDEPVQIYNSNGQLLFSTSMKNRLDLTNYDSGIYFVKVLFKDSVYIKYIMKN